MTNIETTNKLPKAIVAYIKIMFKNLKSTLPFYLYFIIIILVGICYGVFGSILLDGVYEIEDPIERGLSYIALSIIFHALFAKGSEITIKE